MFSDPNKIKLEINNRKITAQSPNVLKLNNILLNNHGSNTKYQEEKNTLN